jgi:hypothetical protein
MKPVVLGLGALALSFFVSSAQAATGDVYSCKSIATAAADEWTSGLVQEADNTENTNEDLVVVIAYGYKYLVPRYLPHDGNGKLPRLGELTYEHNRVYAQELHRCVDFADHKYSLD